MASAIILLVIGIGVLIFAFSGRSKSASGKKYITAQGTCPTCGSPCTWYTDPETGRRSFRCGWCGDFKN